MVVVKIYTPLPAEHFINIKFKGFRGTDCAEEDFTLADLPYMNLNDWISLFLILLKDEVKYESIVSHLRRMLICYIYEVAKLVVEIAFVLKKKQVVNPKEDTTEFEKRKLSKMKKADWRVVYQRREGDKVKKSLFFLLDKHLYSATTLNHIIKLTVTCKVNNEGDLKCFFDMIKWYIIIQNTLLMTKLFKVHKVQH
ncbi:unnamed protein product [Lactuca saligna]|uniref:Uncharacterized protein n=1 Tax=Lactuca saligna TaxID=75948 RepID=A0AA36DZW5_LACSI|nr:unnamed protein product [Lactuca saligna]